MEVSGEWHTLHPCRFTSMGRDSSVGIATRYGLEGPGIESRWGARFSAPVQNPGVHPASYTMGIGSLSRGVDHSPLPSAEVKERVEQYLWAFVACSRMNFTFNFTALLLRTEPVLHVELEVGYAPGTVWMLWRGKIYCLYRKTNHVSSVVHPLAWSLHLISFPVPSNRPAVYYNCLFVSLHNISHFVPYSCTMLEIKDKGSLRTCRISHVVCAFMKLQGP
jgi:hypothetical protein